MRFLLIVALLLLGGCSLMPSQYSALEDGAAQIVVQSSERTICRDLPIGTWIKLYGASVSRLQGWQDLCFNPIVTPLNEETMVELLKMYPQFANNPPSAPKIPSSTNVPTQNIDPAALPQQSNPIRVPAPVVSTPVPKATPAPATSKKAQVSKPTSVPAPAQAVVPATVTPAQPFGTLPPTPANFGTVN